MEKTTILSKTKERRLPIILLIETKMHFLASAKAVEQPTSIAIIRAPSTRGRELVKAIKISPTSARL